MRDGGATVCSGVGLILGTAGASEGAISGGKAGPMAETVFREGAIVGSGFLRTGGTDVPRFWAGDSEGAEPSRNAGGVEISGGVTLGVGVDVAGVGVIVGGGCAVGGLGGGLLKKTCRLFAGVGVLRGNGGEAVWTGVLAGV